MVQEVEDVLNERLVARYGEGLVLVHENPVPDDRGIRIQERKSLLESGASVNEIRKGDGQEPVTGIFADAPLVAAGLVPLEMLGQVAAPLELDAEDEEPQGEGEIQTVPAQVLQGAQIAAASPPFMSAAPRP